MEQKDILGLIIDIEENSDMWFSIGYDLRKKIDNQNGNYLWPFIFAFEYMFVEKENKEYRQKYGPYAPWIELADGRIFPPPLQQITNGQVREWNQVLEITDNPVISSRLSDLLWERKYSERPDKFARMAIQSFIDVNKKIDKWNDFEKSVGLLRALEIAIQINEKELIDLVIENIINSCKKLLNEENPKSGIILRWIKSIQDLSEEKYLSEVSELLDLSDSVFKENPWIMETLTDYRLKVEVDSKKRKELTSNLVEIWINHANKVGGLGKVLNLQHAIDLARDGGLNEKAKELRKLLQEIPEEEMGFKEIELKTELKKDQIDKFIQSFLETEGWEKTLIKFGSYGPPSGNYKVNIEKVEEAFKNHPLRFLVTNVVFDDNNAPLKSFTNIDENKFHELIRQEMLGIEIFSIFAADILTKIFTKYDLTNKQLTNYFITSIIPKEIAENISNALIMFKHKEYDAVGHLLAPRIEKIIRILNQLLGFPIIKEPFGDRYGGVISLGESLGLLDGRIDESWRRYLLNLLVLPVGINIRNRICHGLLDKISNREAALLIHAVCYLRLLRIEKKN